MQEFKNYFTPKICEVINYIFNSEKIEKYGCLKEHFYIFCKSSNNNIVFRANSGEVISSLAPEKISSQFNIYISKNSLKTSVCSDNKLSASAEEGRYDALISGGKNSKSKAAYKITNCDGNILGLKNIVIDIDCHDALSPEELDTIKNSFMPCFIEYCEENQIPTPTLIYWSGRGFHIYYSIFEAYKKTQSWLYTLVVDKLIDSYQKFLDAYPFSLEELKIDTAASHNISGLIRLIGTPNPATIINPEIILFDKHKFTLDELADIYAISRNINSKTKNIKTCKNENELAKFRLNILEKYVDDKSGYGCREIIAHLYYNYAVQIYDRDTAIKKLQNINQKFYTALLPNELNSIIRNINKHGVYKYSNKAFIIKLNLNDKEIALYHINDGCRKAKYYATKKIARQKKKNERDKKIIAIYRKTLSFKETAIAVGVCINTVKKVIRTNNIIVKDNRKAVRNRKIIANYFRTKKTKTAAKAGKVCLNTAKKIIKAYTNLRYCLMNKLQNDEIPNTYFLYQLFVKHFYWTKREFKVLKRAIAEYTGLDDEDISIALNSYCRLA